MMKMGMRPQKKQAGPTTIKHTYAGAQPAPVSTFKRHSYLMTGYKNFEVMVVGAAGGKSGRAGESGAGYARAAGGGGGASRRVTGLLSDLSAVVSYRAGAAGAAGSNAAVSHHTRPIPAEDGVDGESSYFGTHIAVGGSGGEGGVVTTHPTNATEYIITASVGGDGGDNDGGMGFWNDITKVGSGGNGSRGAVTGGADAGPGFPGATAGADDAYLAPEEGTTGTVGGTGGGANIAPITGGAAEYYGTGPGANANGVVYLKIT